MKRRECIEKKDLQIPVPRCPNCASPTTVRNGNFTNKNSGRVQRYLCRACGHKWKFREGHGLAALKIYVREGEFLKSIALVAMGMRLDQVEDLLGPKSETITARLIRAVADAEEWARMCAKLRWRYQVSKRELDRLKRVVLGVNAKEATFHELSPKLRVRLSEKGKQYIQKWRDPVSKSEFLEFCANVGHARSAEEIKTSEAYVDRLEQRCWPAAECKFPEGFKARQERLRDRAEAVLDSTLVGTSWGDLLRPDIDFRRLRWVKIVLGATAEVVTAARPAFTIMEASIFGEIRDPQGGRCYALLEPREIAKPGGRGALTITLAHLIRSHLGEEDSSESQYEIGIRLYANSLKSLAVWLQHVETTIQRHNKTGN